MTTKGKREFMPKNLKNDLKLYLVTDNNQLRGRDFFNVVEEAIRGGVTMVQIREKNITLREFYEKALLLKNITNRYHIPLLINDRVDIAMAVDAEGVHIGQKDIPVSEIRKIFGSEKIIGATANTIELAIEAEKQGADYLGVGALFSTTTKKDTKPISTHKLKEIAKSVKIPVVAIGGISIDNIEKLDKTDIDGVAVSSGIMGYDDILDKTNMFKNMIDRIL